jgi:hypothetical protein
MKMDDVFKSHAEGLSSPPTHAFAVIPDDATDLQQPSRCINVGITGNVLVTMLGNEIVTLRVAAGVTFPVRARRIWATGTTATNLVVMY